MPAEELAAAARLAAVGAKDKVISPGLRELILAVFVSAAFPVGTGHAQLLLNVVPSV